MCNLCSNENHGIPRRDFMKTMGISAAGVSLGADRITEVFGAGSNSRGDEPKAVINCAFTYPHSSNLEEVGYYSWPGASFKAEARQKQYSRSLKGMEQGLGIKMNIAENPLDKSESVDKFISNVKATKPAGLLLFPFKKSHFENIVRIVRETQLPTIILATQGVLLVGHVRQLYNESGVFMINSLDNLDAVEYGIRMIRTGFRMRNKTILNINYSERSINQVPGIGTRVVTVPIGHLIELYDKTEVTREVQNCANDWWNNAEKIAIKEKADTVKAARAYYALKKLIKEENADAMMMNCLNGVRSREHVPPCMGYMRLRDEGIPSGCEADLNSTLCMMMLQELFNKPAFQHNESVDTEMNTYFGAHCTSASKMKGFDSEPEPFELWDHAEAGWGVVPRVLMEPGTPVTITYYHLSSSEGERPQMAIYSGEVIRSLPLPETGGCRTNVEVKINGMDNVVNFVAGRHTSLIYGDHKKDLQKFCQLMNIEVLSFESS